jgi:hypothetical protein
VLPYLADWDGFLIGAQAFLLVVFTNFRQG